MGETVMDGYTIRIIEESGSKCCPKCGQASHGRGGLGLFAANHDQPVCRSCGKKGAPTMAALLDLAQTAERVGKTCRVLLTPPMASLLDLAHAAEAYSSAR
ncbi:MAG TPA: hypothetical protein VFE62_27470 [Gemmataceae bacterium]|nr:hypothetical protein [Gemmataceae bacterium]